MSGLRWTLGLITAIAAAGFLVLAIIGGGFRRSFGASDNSGLWVTIIVTSSALVLASLLWPDKRVLMHIVAALMVGLCILCAFIARESAGTAAMGALYAVAWLTFYYRTVWATAAP
jgi:hypothetical protein